MLSDPAQSLPLDTGAVVGPRLAESDGVSLTLVPECGRFSLRGRAELRAVIEENTALRLPEKVGGVWSGETAAVFCLGPHEWQINCDVDGKEDIRQDIAAAVDGGPCSLVDISHRNLGVEIAGPRAAAMLNVGCPLDFEPRNFPIGKCARTIFERAEIMVNRRGEEAFLVEMWRSFAPYFLMILERRAAG